MEVYQQEFLLAKIIAGYSRYKLPKNVSVIVKPATIDQNYIAQEVFRETYELAEDRGIFTSKDILNIMIENDMWTPLDVKREEQIPKDIENIKVEMFKNAFKLQERETRRKILRNMEEQLQKVIVKKHSYDFVTCEGLSTYARWNWIIENCTYFEDGTHFNWGVCGISTILQKFRDDMLSDKQFRELSRSDNWRQVWSASKKEGSIFGKPASEFTSEQKSLCMWSGLYDSVYESPEAPAEEIIEDDDLLDGWLIHQRRKSEQEKKKKKAEGVLGRNSEADDIFVMAHNREDALEVESMNDDVATMIKKERQIYKDSMDGPVKDSQLPDVRRGIMAQAREQFKNRR
tara:strand:- start:580 stop:1614 length:1035 start_codon:yes stop_codon:yes gene_type:complete